MTEKSKLEEKVMEGVYGKKELKKDEKNKFLGQFRERVLCYLTFNQVEEDAIYPEVLKIISANEADQVIINRKIKLKAAEVYIKSARENNIKYKRVNSPDFKSDTALVVASDGPVHKDNIKVKDRTKRLQEKSISDKIIKNVGAYLCQDCWSELMEKAPEEKINYKKISLFDKLIGTKCVCK